MKRLSIQIGSMCCRIGLLLLLGLLPMSAAQAQAMPLEQLRAKHAELREALDKSNFSEPLVLTSSDSGEKVTGEVYAEVRRAYADIAAAFRSANKVCELLMLHLNVRACTASSGSAGEALELSIGPKRAAAPGMIYRMRYAMRIEDDTPQYQRVLLTAKAGPMATSDYRIVFEAMPLQPQLSLVHFSYAYEYGTLAKMAMSVYLATAGRAKIGFSVSGRASDGRPLYVTGERGALERNVMRYYLALLAFVNAPAGSQRQQTEQRLRSWFQMTERYAAQLHELDLDEYLDEKHRDFRDRLSTPD
jgi:hypothetical protein